MTTLDQIPETEDPTHLLLVGDTKVGKSWYVTQCVKDGYLVIYVDSDNGISALRRALTKEQQKNVIYLGTEKPARLVKNLLTDSVFRWNITADKEMQSGLDKPDDKVVIMTPVNIPKGVILCVDSWSSVSLNAMGVSATANKTTLENMSNEGGKMQDVYGDAGMEATLICAVIQHCPFHVIVLAHGTIYERYEKPAGVINPKQRDMILKETLKIPLSTSRPNGWTMGKYFTDIGWLEIDVQERRMLDYKARHGRVGGGTVNKLDTVENLAFSKTFAPPPDPRPELDPEWIRYTTVAEFAAARKSTSLPISPARPAGPSDGVIAKPATTTMNALLQKAK